MVVCEKSDEVGSGMNGWIFRVPEAPFLGQMLQILVLDATDLQLSLSRKELDN